ncbi:MAG TPA: electron transfer flavoprotein subunit beta/FixA family protein [Acidimicrobiia bacterium]|nr:electron transfer flavoprotein subunit beta/FixA family protein [Acidimicrobiia bacterium]
MHIVVGVKQIPDLEKIRIKADTREPVLEGVPARLGDWDKCAVEEAVRIKESRDDVKVTAVAIGSPKLKDTIKEALAIGADEAVILTDRAFAGSDEGGTARTLAKVIEKLGEVDLILLGEGSTDDHTGQVPSRLAELLGLPQVTYVRQLEVLEGGRLRAVRDLEEALEVVEVGLPAVVSVTGEINTPRLPPLTAILKAARKPTQPWGPADIGLAPEEVGAGASAVRVLSNLAPVQERKEIVLEGSADEVVDELLKALEREGVLA